MIYNLETLEEIQAFLTHLRSDTKSRRKFPKEVWESIIRLSKEYSVEEICEHLEIQPAYLKQKLRKFQESQSEVEFREVSCQSQSIHSCNVTIELVANSGLRAKIQGSISCLNCLPSLFRG